MKRTIFTLIVLSVCIPLVTLTLSLVTGVPDEVTRLISALFAGYVFADIWELITCHYLPLDGGQEIEGLHFHHSLLILPAAIIGVIMIICNFGNLGTVWIIWGIGVLLQHTLQEKRLVFVEKSK